VERRRKHLDYFSNKVKTMKTYIKQNGRRYTMAAGVGSLATYLAGTVPGVRDIPMEVTVPLILAAIHFAGDMIKKRFHLDITKP